MGHSQLIKGQNLESKTCLFLSTSKFILEDKGTNIITKLLLGQECTIQFQLIGCSAR